MSRLRKCSDHHTPVSYVDRKDGCPMCQKVDEYGELEYKHSELEATLYELRRERHGIKLKQDWTGQ